MTLPRGPEPHEWDRHMSAEDAMSRMIERKGLDVGAVCNAAEHAAGRALRNVELADHFLDAQWWAAMGAWRDVMDADAPIDLVPVEPLASVTLLANRRDEVLRRESNILADYEAGVEAKVAAFESSSQAGLASLRDPWPHNDGDCHGSRCEACGCCMHSTSACAVRDLPVGMQCVPGCGCEGRS